MQWSHISATNYQANLFNRVRAGRPAPLANTRKAGRFSEPGEFPDSMKRRVLARWPLASRAMLLSDRQYVGRLVPRPVPLLSSIPGIETPVGKSRGSEPTLIRIPGLCHSSCCCEMSIQHGSSRFGTSGVPCPSAASFTGLDVPFCLLHILSWAADAGEVA